MIALFGLINTSIILIQIYLIYSSPQKPVSLENLSDDSYTAITDRKKVMARNSSHTMCTVVSTFPSSDSNDDREDQFI